MSMGLFKKNKVFGINMLYILSLIPIICFSFYKNGYLVYKAGYIPLFYSFRYLAIPIVIILLSYVFEVYYCLIVKKDEDSSNAFNSMVPFINTLCYLVCGPMDNLFLTSIMIILIDLLLKLIDWKFKLNQVALYKCLLFGILTFLGSYNNMNLYESAKAVTYSASKIFMGFGVGEVGATCSLFAIVGFVILLFNSYYKKSIPIISIISYFAVAAVVYFVGGSSFSKVLTDMFASGFIFAAVFVASLSTDTPVIMSGKLLYSVLFGILSAVSVHVLHLNIGIYVAILILSLLSQLFDRLRISLD